MKPAILPNRHSIHIISSALFPRMLVLSSFHKRSIYFRLFFLPYNLYLRLRTYKKYLPCCCFQFPARPFKSAVAFGDHSWVIVNVDGKKFGHVSTGAGIESFQSAFSDDEIQFGVVTVVAVEQGDNITNKRKKVIQVNWIGKNVKPMKRAGALSLKQEVKNHFIGCTLTLDIEDRSALKAQAIAKEIKHNDSDPATFYDFKDVQLQSGDI